MFKQKKTQVFRERVIIVGLTHKTQVFKERVHKDCLERWPLILNLAENNEL